MEIPDRVARVTMRKIPGSTNSTHLHGQETPYTLYSTSGSKTDNKQYYGKCGKRRSKGLHAGFFCLKSIVLGLFKQC